MKKDKSKITRRDFIKFSAAASLIPGSLVNLAQAAESSASQYRVSPDVIKKYPFIARYPYVAKSKVIHCHHAGVWKDDNLESVTLRAMLNAAITELSGVKNASDAWAALFKPGERIAIKVNAFKNSKIWTHAPLVYAVTDCLIDAGIPAEQIFIYDSLSVLKQAGYKPNRKSPGVRCIAEGSHGQALTLSKTLKSCDALINIPVLKSHMFTGITFALKNHFGSVSNPAGLHNGISRNICAVNAMSEIKTRTRLIIGDILEAALNFRNHLPAWRPDYRGDSILMSFDPVAHDAVGLEIFENFKNKKKSGKSSFARKKASKYLEICTKYNLGTHQRKKIDLAEIKLG